MNDSEEAIQGGDIELAATDVLFGDLAETPLTTFFDRSSRIADAGGIRVASSESTALAAQIG